MLGENLKGSDKYCKKGLAEFYLIAEPILLIHRYAILKTAVSKASNHVCCVFDLLQHLLSTFCVPDTGLGAEQSFIGLARGG